MRILLVSNYFAEHVGGVETVADNLVRGYRRRGHRVTWAAAQAGPPHRGHPDDLPLPAWNVTEDHFGFPYPLLTPAAVARLLTAVRRSDAVHVHDCLYEASAVAATAASLMGKRVLLTQHIGIVPYRQPALRLAQQVAYRSLGRLIIGRVDRVAFVSRPVADWFSGWDAKARSAVVVPNGVDTSAFHPLQAGRRAALRAEMGVPGSGTLLLFSGRFVQKKGLHLLEPVARRNPNWTWLLVGRAGDVDPSAWALPNVRVLGTKAAGELARFYQAADLLTIPSTGEGFPVSVQEAMACGTPAVVSTELNDAIPWSVAFHTERTPQAIEASIGRALATLETDPGLRDRVASFARREWDWEVALDRYEALLGRTDPRQQGQPPLTVARS